MLLAWQHQFLDGLHQVRLQATLLRAATPSLNIYSTTMREIGRE